MSAKTPKSVADSTSRKTKVREAANAFNALTKEQQNAKYDEITACLKSGAYKAMKNTSAKKSAAYDYLDIIATKDGKEIYCFFYCQTCDSNGEKSVIFADTSNGTSKILGHLTSFHSENASEKRTSMTDEIKEEQAHSSTSYVFDADSLSIAFAAMTCIGRDHGELQADTISSLLPAPADWSLDWFKDAGKIAELVSRQYPSALDQSPDENVPESTEKPVTPKNENSNSKLKTNTKKQNDKPNASAKSKQIIPKPKPKEGKKNKKEKINKKNDEDRHTNGDATSDSSSLIDGSNTELNGSMVQNGANTPRQNRKRKVDSSNHQAGLNESCSSSGDSSIKSSLDQSQLIPMVKIPIGAIKTAAAAAKKQKTANSGAGSSVVKSPKTKSTKVKPTSGKAPTFVESDNIDMTAKKGAKRKPTVNNAPVAKKPKITDGTETAAMQSVEDNTRKLRFRKW